MTHAQMLAIAAVIRDAQYAKGITCEGMRRYIARDMARELSGVMRSFDKAGFLKLCEAE